jgi:hypothetical protein
MTTFELRCTSNSNRTEHTTIFLYDKLVLDEWTPQVREEWASDGGGLMTPSTDLTLLVDDSAAARHELRGFRASLRVGDFGEGRKNSLDGTFPGGSFTWIIVSKV